MTSYTWILLILASLVATRAQDFDLSDAFDDDVKPTPKPTVKPAPPKNPDSGFDLSDAFNLDFDLSNAFDDDIKPTPKPTVKPAAPKNPDSGFDLSDAFDLGGGSFNDKDIFDVNEGGEYKPDGGRSGGLQKMCRAGGRKDWN